MIIKISKQFAVDSNLLKDNDAMDIINKIEKNNGNASMIMLGNAVFSDTKFEGSAEFRISNKGAFVY